MKILALGYKDFGGLRWKYGEAEYVDVSDSFQDVMATQADVVAVNTDKTESSIVDKIREYEAVSAGELNTEFLYQSGE